MNHELKQSHRLEIAGKYAKLSEEIAQAHCPTGEPETPAQQYSRREFHKILAILAGGVAIGELALAKRIGDIESGGLYFEHSDAELLLGALQYQGVSAEMETGNHPDTNIHVHTKLPFDIWAVPDQLKEAAGREDAVGVFFSLEDIVDRGKVDELLGLLELIKQRGALPILNLHMYSRPNKRHPFHEENFEWMKQHAQWLRQKLDDLEWPVEIRLFYEMNLPNGFIYGPARQIPTAAHQSNYQQIAGFFAQEMTKANFPRWLAFSPSAQYPFEGYFADKYQGVEVFRRLGVDGYNFLPEDLHTLLQNHADLGALISRIFDPNYLITGRRSPEQIFEKSLQSLVRLSVRGRNGESRRPIGYYETGDKTQNPLWLQHAFLLLGYYGGSFGYLFLFNKAYQEAVISYEGDWTPTKLMILVYGLIIKLLNLRIDQPHEVTVAGLYPNVDLAA